MNTAESLLRECGFKRTPMSKSEIGALRRLDAPRRIAILRTMFSYDAETGDIRRLYVGRARLRVGYLGYKRISQFRAHVLAWELYYGTEAPSLIDHVNGDPGDNRIANLRSGNWRINNRNRRKTSVITTSQYKGVSQRDEGAYRAAIWSAGRNHCLGSYRTDHEAANEYNKAAVRLYSDAACINPIGSKAGIHIGVRS